MSCARVRKAGRAYVYLAEFWKSLNDAGEFEDLNRYLARRIMFHPRNWHMEGGVSSWQASCLRDIIAQTKSQRIVQIGFNAGHSAQAILSSAPNVTLISFDLGVHSYVPAAVRYIDKRFPGRHQLVLGDSARMVPDYVSTHPEERFDIIFIDGGHSFQAAWSDITNCRALCRPGGLVIVDDLTPERSWGVGPDLAWNEALRTGLVDQIERYVEPTTKQSPRIFAVGRYCGL